MENITIKINGVEVSAPKGSTILEAARIANIDIPTPYQPIWVMPTSNDGKYEPFLPNAICDNSFIFLPVFAPIYPSIPPNIPNKVPPINIQTKKSENFTPDDNFCPISILPEKNVKPNIIINISILLFFFIF